MCFKFAIQQIVRQVIWIFALPGTSMVVVLNGGFNPAAPANPKHPFVIKMSIVVTIQFIFEPAVSHLRMLFMNVFN